MRLRVAYQGVGSRVDATNLSPSQVAEKYLYYIEPLLFHALRGTDPYVEEIFPCFPSQV